MKERQVRVTIVAVIALAGALIAVGLHAWSVGGRLDSAETELRAERFRSRGLQLDAKRACEQHLRMVRGVDILLNDPARPKVDDRLKRDLGDMTTSEFWFADCKAEHEEMMKFLYGTPEERRQQLDAIADEVEQRRLQFENKRYWILRDGEKIWIEPDPVPGGRGAR